MKGYFLSILFYCFAFSQDEYLITIDASSYSNWVYYSLSTHSILDCDQNGANCADNHDWDLAFQRKHIRTNSGLAGSRNGGAYVDSSMVWSQEWININEIPTNIEWLEDTTANDFYDLQTHTFVEGVKNPALNSWGWFDESYVLNPTNYILFVKSANGQSIFKFWPYNYYVDGSGGFISIRYQAINIICNNSGDVNGDDATNVLDVVAIVSNIVSGNNYYNECADLNDDGALNVLDVVAIVTSIINQ